MAIAYVTGPVFVWIVVPRSVATQQLLSSGAGRQATSRTRPGIAATPPTLAQPTAGSFRDNDFSMTPGHPGFPAVPPRTITEPGESSVSPTFTTVTAIQRVPYFLGTCEEVPRVVKRKTFQPVYADVSGPKIPFDDIWTGEEAWIFGTLTRWNEAVYRMIAAVPRPGSNEGTDSSTGRGTLMMSSGAGYQLVLRYPHYDNHPLFLENGMMPGERYLCGYLKGEDAHVPGLAPNRRILAWYSQSIYNRNTRKFYLFNHDMNGIPAYPGEDDTP